MSMMVSPYAFGGAAAASYATNESLAEQSTTGTSLSGASLSGTFTAASQRIVFWSQEVENNSTSSTSTSDVTVNGSSIFTANPPITTPKESVSPVDYQTMGGFFRHTASGASETFAASCSRGNAATIKLRNSRISYIPFGADDAYGESIARQTFTDPTNKTAQTAATLNFTPPSSGDYIILASFCIDMTASTNVSYGMELTDGTSTTGEIISRPVGGNDRCPVMLAIKLTGASGSKTISLKVRQAGTGTTSIGVSEIRLIAIRTSRFANVYWSGILGTTSAGTDSTYVTAQSQTFTPAAANHLTLAAWQMGSTSTSASAYSQYLDDATTVNEFIREFGTAVNTQGYGAVSHRLAAYAASSRTQAIQRHGEGAVNNAVQRSAAIVTFDLTGL